ncbi:tRNA (cytosine(32)/uridine(32)-2'-O)-methyltransferase TrmJ [Motilimonas cestriensis]|uniref:tRNA (cytidine/uridine-2'-O-)-methyltransferase TrmJ n=1 Tax=Motilimonas cestriensis TaxID=2742685 RepID=A0ABS8W878_9GAMM|nr:tRNA (cytosine(32)/uridine(32)-2'-O)-methyltransferase TrmJ [Motilimonas cestriensis]MCE2594572.1 tRNA (cytosine(32)/uridine(32)-2'-O)-methyltransferase TrmJ [Motilimonas cestriensis]
MLENVRIVLIGTSHPGNIGSAARAMKTMGIHDLVLVTPDCEVDSHTIALSAGASDVVKNIITYENLEDAIADCQLVVGASARSRTLNWPMFGPRDMAAKVVQEGQDKKVAMVFGRERTGLTNDELQRCHFHVNIPANPDYSSLNLAMAVQTLCYEVRMTFLAQESWPKQEQEYPLSADLERFYQHLEGTLAEVEFIVPSHPGQVMNKLRRFFNRARPEVQELNILRGMLTSIDKAVQGIRRPEKRVKGEPKNT